MTTRIEGHRALAIANLAFALAAALMAGLRWLSMNAGAKHFDGRKGKRGA